MRLRCTDCRFSAWVDWNGLDAHAGFSCDRCGKEHQLGCGTVPPESELAQQALALARERGLDLATATSVLLGLAPLEQPSADIDPAPAVPPDGDPASPPHSAVTHNGEEAARAEAFARSHRLSLELAESVVRGELSLHGALMLQPSRPVVARSSNAIDPERRSRKPLVVVAAAAFLLAFVWLRSGGEDASASRNEATVHEWASAAEVSTGATGGLLQIAGPTPQSVLAAFCESFGRGDHVPLELRVADPASAGVRIGVFRESSDIGPLRAIRIERRQREWVAGGTGGIEVTDPPRAVPGSPTMSVAALKRGD